jgi:hypothetical protein
MMTLYHIMHDGRRIATFLVEAHALQYAKVGDEIIVEVIT